MGERIEASRVGEEWVLRVAEHVRVLLRGLIRACGRKHAPILPPNGDAAPQEEAKRADVQRV